MSPALLTLLLYHVTTEQKYKFIPGLAWDGFMSLPDPRSLWSVPCGDSSLASDGRGHLLWRSWEVGASRELVLRRITGGKGPGSGQGAVDSHFSCLRFMWYRKLTRRQHQRREGGWNRDAVVPQLAGRIDHSQEASVLL